MKLEQLKRIVNKAYNTDLTTQSRKNEFKIPRFVFCSYARKYLKNAKGKRITLDEIAIFLDQNHATVKHATNVCKSLLDYYTEYDIISKNIEVTIRTKLGLKIKKPTQIEIPDNTLDIRECEKDVLNGLKDLSDSDVLEFIDSRLKPFVSMLKSKQVQTTYVVAGAKRKFSIN